MHKGHNYAELGSPLLADFAILKGKHVDLVTGFWYVLNMVLSLLLTHAHTHSHKHTCTFIIYAKLSETMFCGDWEQKRRL